MNQPLKVVTLEYMFYSQFEVCRELTQHFCLCFEGVIAGGQSDDCRRGGFNNCGSNRGKMKWTN